MARTRKKIKGEKKIVEKIEEKTGEVSRKQWWVGE